MIRRIELINFMSHKHTVINLADGLTVLVGPNNCGKSAVVKAFQILCYNNRSTFVTRHGESECLVRVETDDGHTIEWVRKNSPQYKIDGDQFDRLGKGGVPDKLYEVLRLPRVQSDREEFDVHFAEQKSPIFLLNASPSHAAGFFASSSDAIRLIEMQSLHKQKVTEARRDKQRLREEAEKVTEVLEKLEPVPNLQDEVGKAESEHATLLNLAWQVEEVEKLVKELHATTRLLSRHDAVAQKLGALEAPPKLESPDPLAQLIKHLERTQQRRQYEAGRTKALGPLAESPPPVDIEPLTHLIRGLQQQTQATVAAQSRTEKLASLDSPPQMEDENALNDTIFALEAAQYDVQRWHWRHELLQEVQTIPETIDTSPLSQLIDSLEQADADVKKYKKATQAAKKKLQQAEQSLRDWAESNGICPTCGGRVDPDQLVEQTAAGIGGHDHG
ncbi:MAG: AAA family ATPase [Candidatus Bipolaricaulia bacterium]